MVLFFGEKGSKNGENLNSSRNRDFGKNEILDFWIFGKMIRSEGIRIVLIGYPTPGPADCWDLSPLTPWWDPGGGAKGSCPMSTHHFLAFCRAIAPFPLSSGEVGPLALSSLVIVVGLEPSILFLARGWLNVHLAFYSLHGAG